MKKAGCEGVFLGVESGCDAILKKMNKTARKKHYRQAIRKFKEVGIPVHINIIIGFPGETQSTVQETMDFIEETKPNTYRAQIWYADPATPVWSKKQEYKIEGASFNWSHYSMDYSTACDIIEKIFLSVETSIWLPLYGFYHWGLFYLLRRGMTMPQVENFLKNFDMIMKDRLINPNKKDIDPILFENLKQSCLFDSSFKNGTAATFEELSMLD